MVGGVSGTFLEMPKMDFNLTGMGEMVELPGLIDAIRSVINSQVDIVFSNFKNKCKVFRSQRCVSCRMRSLCH